MCEKVTPAPQYDENLTGGRGQLQILKEKRTLA